MPPPDAAMSSEQANAKTPAAAGRRRDSHLVSVLVVLFALLSGLVLYAWGPDNTAPKPGDRAAAPAAPQ
jgi:hypothetical protein